MDDPQQRRTGRRSSAVAVSAAVVAVALAIAVPALVSAVGRSDSGGGGGPVAVPRVLGTAHVFVGPDPHGCPATAAPVALGDGNEARTPAPWQRLSVCRYALAPPDSHVGGVLEQSELLSAADSASAWQALRAAPRGAGPDADPEDCGGRAAARAVLLRTASGEVAWVHDDGCSGHGIELLGVGSRRLTQDVLLWAVRELRG